MESFTLDDKDRKILSLLQQDATTPINEIADAVGLSVSPCWRRIQKLDEHGYVERRVALLSPDKMNVGVTVFVNIRTNRHSEEWLDKFCKAAMRIPEIIDIYRMSGHIDYLLRVVVPDVAAFDTVYKRIIKISDIHDVTSSFALERIKSTTALPVHYAK